VSRNGALPISSFAAFSARLIHLISTKNKSAALIVQADAFLSLGVQLDVETMVAIFRWQYALDWIPQMLSYLSLALSLHYCILTIYSSDIFLSFCSALSSSGSLTPTSRGQFITENSFGHSSTGGGWVCHFTSHIDAFPLSQSNHCLRVLCLYLVRAMVRQWKRNTDGFTPHQLREKFHQFDVNGDGKLNYREFQHLLLSFGIALSEPELDTLVARFDDDGDGCIDMHEFFAFIEGEKETLLLDPQHEAEQLQRSIRGTANAGERTRSYSPHRSRQERPSPSPSRGISGRSASDWSRSEAPPALQPNWDHSPARRRPPTSTSTYESVPSPVGRSLKTALSPSIRFSDDRSRSSTRRHSDSGYGADSRRSDSRGEGKVREGEISRVQSGTSRDDDDRIQEGHMKGVTERRRRERDLKSEYDDRPIGKIYTVIDEKEGAQSYRTYVHSKSDHDIQFQFEGEDGVSGAEALWAAKMLQAQAHVEMKLGRGYY
jgi:EF-hand domain pair